MANIFAKKEISKVKSQALDPGSMGVPVSAEDFLHRGIAFYARGQYDVAEADLRDAIAKYGNQIDAYYVLGMVCKAAGRKVEATEAFNQVLQLLNSSTGEKSTRTDMLRRLALGHINMINQGDWNLEKEIWQRIP